MSVRIGFIGLMSLLHFLFGISTIQLIHWATPILTTLIALGYAGVVYRSTKNSLFAFAITFFFSLWATSTFVLSITTFDNAFGQVFVLGSIFFALGQKNSWRRAIGVFISATLVGLTHLESFIFLCLVVGLYGLITISFNRSLMIFFKTEKKLILAFMFSAAITTWHWFNQIIKIFHGYSVTADPAGNASIPYAHVTNFSGFWSFLTTGIPNRITTMVVIAAIVSLIVTITRHNNREIRLFTAYIFSGYIVVLYAILRASIPINRAILLLPVSILLGYGLYHASRYLYQSRYRFVTLTVFILILLFIFPPAEYVSYLRRFPRAISSTVPKGLNELNNYITEHQSTSIIIISDIKPDIRAASAYYGLWYNWITAILPLSITERQVCLYLGTMENLRMRRPTVSASRPEYKDASLVGISCIQKLRQPVEIFQIQGIGQGPYPLKGNNIQVEYLAPTLVRISEK